MASSGACTSVQNISTCPVCSSKAPLLRKEREKYIFYVPPFSQTTPPDRLLCNQETSFRFAFFLFFFTSSLSSYSRPLKPVHWQALDLITPCFLQFIMPSFSSLATACALMFLSSTLLTSAMPAAPSRGSSSNSRDDLTVPTTGGTSTLPISLQVSQD